MSRHHRLTGNREWDRIREQALTRDKRRCRLCKKAGRLEVHHRKPLEHGGDNAYGQPGNTLSGLPPSGYISVREMMA